MKQSAIFCVTALLAAALVSCSNSGETDITTDNVTSAAHTEAADVGTADTRDMHGVPVDTLEFGELLSKNGVLLTGDDTVSGKRCTAVAYYSYHRK